MRSSGSLIDLQIDVQTTSVSPARAKLIAESFSDMMSQVYDCPLCAKEVKVIDFGSSGPVRCWFCNGQFRTEPVKTKVPPPFDYVRKSRPPIPPSLPSHLPYCDNCRTRVNPNVVAVNESAGGVILPTFFGAVYRPVSSTRLVKVCPHCGNQVFSEQDKH